jgi:hypothetical protein
VLDRPPPAGTADPTASAGETPKNDDEDASHSQRLSYWGLPVVVLHDISTGAWIIDVSEVGPNSDRSLLQPAQDVVLVCFGTHAIGDCPFEDGVHAD